MTKHRLATNIYSKMDQEVNLRPIPFHDVKHVLVKSVGLVSLAGPGRMNETTIEFKLTVEQADLLAMNPEKRHVLLRFCNFEPSELQNDNFPPECQVIVNGANVTLPQAISNPNKPNIPAKRPGQHVDISRNCKFCPYVSNLVIVKWSIDPTCPKRCYAANVTVTDRVTSQLLLERIQDRGPSDPELTKRLINDSDNEVATTNLQSSLLCPLGKMRMSAPCKSTRCEHFRCFDALFYLKMNERKASWTCPICYKPAYFEELMLDGFFINILENSDPSVTDVVLNLDGTWSPVVKMEQPATAKQPVQEVITISDDDD